MSPSMTYASDFIVIPGVLISISLLVVVSLLTSPSPTEKWAPFFQSTETDGADEPPWAEQADAG